MNIKWVVAAVAAAGLAAAVIVGGTRATSGAGESSGPSKPLSPEVCDAGAKPANLNFTLKDSAGKDVSLASFKGKVILLDFWATWCGPCQAEIPGFIELHEKYQAKGLAVVGVQVQDPDGALLPFMQKFKMTYPILVGNGRDDFEEAYAPIWGLPTTFIISRDGTLCRKRMGLHPKEQFEKDVLGLL